ncbi:MAG: acetyl-CoA carboxylase biotin carboxyl carrier protein subunit [Deltaproteobacteria bacterium]|nr:acetyl-CoA carboxylase biotin carboxyl carrier protein subunit [Deltaproteobacteria bacterium]
MKEWIVARDGNPTTVLIDGGPDAFRCRVGKHAHRAALINATETTVTLLFDGARVVHADLRWEGNTCHCIVDHIPYTFTIHRTWDMGQRRASRVSKEGAVAGGLLYGLDAQPAVPRYTIHDIRYTEVRAPMPARVVEVRVKKGYRVQIGQPLCVVEAMKMQNEIPSPATGRVAALFVETGQIVEANQPLLRIE